MMSSTVDTQVDLSTGENCNIQQTDTEMNTQDMDTGDATNIEQVGIEGSNMLQNYTADLVKHSSSCGG